MKQEEVKDGGECDMLSVKPSSQKEDMPKTESEDAVMSDQKIAEVQSQDQALDDVDDMQVISEDQFNNPRGSELAKDHKAAASELPGETSVKQKSNTEGLRVQVRVLNDQLGAIDRDQQIRDRELKQAQAQLATTKQALQKSKAQWKRQNEVVKKLRANLKESKDKVRGMGVTNSDLQEKLVTSEEELTRCRDDVFSLQPMVLVADSTIVEELEIVREGVVHWIETEVTSFEKAHPEAEEEHIFSVGDDEEAAIFLAQHPGAGEHLARYLIHRFFKANLFGSRYDVLGLTEETARLLQKAEHSMAHADPPKDSARIAAWRSETLQALAATGECQTNKKKQLEEMNDQLFRELAWIFPMFFTRLDSMESFYQQVLEPAAKVATMIKTSASTYKYFLPDQPFQKRIPLVLTHMEKYKMLDIKNGSYLKANAAVIADKQGNIGKCIIPLEPGLYRTKEGQGQTLLLSVTCLVELNHPVVKSRPLST